MIVLRLLLGWVFLYAGITKIFDETWTAAPYLENATTFPQLFAWLASPDVIGIVNILNEWGLALIGLALILGFANKLATGAGIFLMILYYLPVLDFPYVGGHSFLVDEHIIYIVILYFTRLSGGKAGFAISSVFSRSIR